MAGGYDQFFKNAKKTSGQGANMPGSTLKNKKTSASKANGKSSGKNLPQSGETAEQYLRRALSLPEDQKRRRKSSVIPTAILTALVALGFAALGYYHPEKFDRGLNLIEVNLGFGSPAQAQTKDGENAAATSGNKKAESADPTKIAEKKECVEMKGFTEEELSHFNKLNERKTELDLREAELTALEEELHKQKAEIETRIGKLEQIREEVGTVLKERVELDQARVGTLVDFYSNMKPKQAADIFGKLNEDLAVEVLGKMKKKNAADILNLLEPAKARALSEKFTGYQRR